MRELRKRKRAQNKQRDIKLSLLEEENELQREENELLRRSIIALREQIERVKKHNYLNRKNDFLYVGELALLYLCKLCALSERLVLYWCLIILVSFFCALCGSVLRLCVCLPLRYTVVHTKGTRIKADKCAACGLFVFLCTFTGTNRVQR